VALDELPVDDGAAALAEQRVGVRVDEVLVRPEKIRSLKLRIRGIRSNPNKLASANTSADWPCVSARTVDGWISDLLASRPSMRCTASHTPQGMNLEKRATHKCLKCSGTRFLPPLRT
jgi:hypothetical protein